MLVLSDGSSEAAKALSLRTFNYWATESAGMLDSVADKEMIIADGARHGGVDETCEQVIFGCAKALKNGSAVAYIGAGA